MSSDHETLLPFRPHRIAPCPNVPIPDCLHVLAPVIEERDTSKLPTQLPNTCIVSQLDVSLELDLAILASLKCCTLEDSGNESRHIPREAFVAYAALCNDQF